MFEQLKIKCVLMQSPYVFSQVSTKLLVNDLSVSIVYFSTILCLQWKVVQKI